MRLIRSSGCGPLGLLIMAVAKAYGAKKILALDVEQARVDFAVKHYATAGAVCPKSFENDESMDAARAWIKDLLKQHDLSFGVDVSIEVAGAESCLQMAIFALRPGGTCEWSILTLECIGIAY